MFDVSKFRLQDMTACSAALRKLGAGASSIEMAADRITRYLYTALTTGADGDPACALVRLFKTHPYDRLSPKLQALVEARLGDKPADPGMKCLTLLASTGAVEGWNDPAQSSRFRAIPLSGPEALATLPMFSQLFAQFHIDLPFLEQAGSSLLMDRNATTFNAFYVPQALGSPYVPAQTEFVVPFGIQSVFGFGGLLSTGEMFAVILFAKVPVTKDTADLFKAFALSTKLTLAPFEHTGLILPPTVNTSSVDQTSAATQLTAWQDRVATLESILAVQEHAVEFQSDRLEATLADTVRHGQKLQKQSMRFEALSATSPVGIFETDAEGSCLYTNAAWQAITRLSLSDTLGDGWSRAICEEDRARVFAAWNQTARAGSEFSLEFRMQRPDGTIRWVHARSRPLRDAAEQIVGHVGTTEDITERKEAEETATRSHDMLKSFVEHTPAAVAMLDKKLRYVAASKRWLQDYRLGEQNIIGRHHYDLFPEIKAMPEWQAIHQRCLAGAVERREEDRFVRADGSDDWLRWEVRPWQDSTGAIGGIIMFTEVISERKKVEKALRESETRLQEAQAMARLGSWELDLGKNRLLWSDEIFRIFEIDQAQFGASYEAFLDAVHPGDRAPVHDAYTQSVQNRTPYEIVHRLQMADGRIKYVQERGETHYDHEGRPQRSVGTVQDITERKQADEALRQSEERFRLTLDVATDGFWDWDLRTQQALYSPRWIRLLGLENQDIPLNNVNDWKTRIHPDDRAMVEQVLADHMEGKSAGFSVEHRIRHRSGGWKWFAIRGQVTHQDQQGRPLRMMGMLIDITARKRSDAARFTLQQAINHAQDGMALLDDTGQYTYMNPAHAAIYGYTVDELLGHHWTELYHPEWAAMIEHMYLQILHEEGQWQGEVVGKKNTGEGFYVDLSLTLLEESGTDRHAILCTCRDISRRKQMEQELIEAKDSAEAGIRAKSEFLATMSHEIRTPMNGVLGMTDLLADTTLTSEQREYVHTIRHSGESLMRIINDILDFSKIEAGKLPIESLPFDVRLTIEDTLDLLAPAAHAKKLELIGLIDAQIPDAVIGDPGRIRQILTNLIGNAIKFTESGEVLAQVLAAEDTESSLLLRFEIVDTGAGLTEEAKAKLFQSFTQADSSTARKYGGTGLGLAICKRLTDLMGGQIGMQSYPETGTCVWFTVRLRKQTAAPPSPTPALIDSLAGLRICLVDDNATNRSLLQYHACDWKMHYESAESGPSALALIRRAAAGGAPFDLAILDMHMPGMDGLQLGRAIREDANLAHTKLVLLTSLGRRGDAKLAHSAGFSGYLTKPIRKGHLYDCLRLVMGQSPVSRRDSQAAPAEAPLITRHQVAEVAAHTRLLVVDDNPVNQKVAVKMLEKLGCRVDVASNGNEALAALTRHHYNLVFMDCQMPELDGFETTKMIRTHEQPGTRLPIIAMTANAMAGDREHCLASDMDDFVSKPVKSQDLHRVLTQWLPPSDNRAVA